MSKLPTADDVIGNFKQEIFESLDKQNFNGDDEILLKLQANVAQDTMVNGLKCIIKNLETQLSRERKEAKDTYLRYYQNINYANTIISSLREEIIELSIENKTLDMANNILHYKLAMKDNEGIMPKMNKSN